MYLGKTLFSQLKETSRPGRLALHFATDSLGHPLRENAQPIEFIHVLTGHQGVRYDWLLAPGAMPGATIPRLPQSRQAFDSIAPNLEH